MSDTQNNDGGRAGTAAVPHDEEPPSGRRTLMKSGFAAAVAAVVGLGSARRVQGANGDPVEVGTTHNGTSTTTLTGGTTLRVTNGTSSGEAALYGSQNNSSRYGVRGENSAAGTGVYGLATGADGGRGVHGQAAAADGMGVFGSAEAAGGAGIVGDGNRFDLLADGSGRIGITKIGQAGSPDSPGESGVLARDDDASLWWSYGADQWRRLAGPTTAGAFHPIDPIRAYDSRVAAYAANGLLAPNQSRVISVADGHDAVGTATAVGAVPAGATAVAYNVTVTGTTASNFLSVVPGDASGFTTSTINWTGANQSLANGSIVKLDASRQVKLFGGYDSGATHVIIDITGYFL